MFSLLRLWEHVKKETGFVDWFLVSAITNSRRFSC